jgi:hypothetical protein
MESTQHSDAVGPRAVIWASLVIAPKCTFESDLLHLADALAAGLDLRSSHGHGMLQFIRRDIQSDAARVSSELANQGRWTACRLDRDFLSDLK